jgi:hypothetical protein
MSGTTETPTVSGGSGTTTPPAPTYAYVVTQPGHGFDVGTWIEDPNVIALDNLATADWVARATIPAMVEQEV